MNCSSVKPLIMFYILMSCSSVKPLILFYILMNCSSVSGVSTLGAHGALPHQIQMALWCRKLNTSVLCGKICLILFNMPSSDSIVNVCMCNSRGRFGSKCSTQRQRCRITTFTERVRYTVIQSRYKPSNPIRGGQRGSSFIQSRVVPQVASCRVRGTGKEEANR